MSAPPLAERGAATLLVVLGLVLLATLASAYSSRAVLTDLLASQGLARAAQARLAAQAALATAEAALLQPQALDPAQYPFSGPEAPCPSDLKGQQWQCSPLPLTPDTLADAWPLGATLARDLVEAPHVWQVHASATSSFAAGPAQVRESVFMPVLAPAPSDAPPTALILNGCASAAAGSAWHICAMGSSACESSSGTAAVFSHFVPDTDGNGRIGAAERDACLTFPATGTAPEAPASRSPCNRAAWRSVFGDTTPEQLRAWSDAQAHHGLAAQSQPPRSIYWVDSPADWTQSLGSAEHPVLLVLSSQACAQRCPRIASGAHIYGTVFVDAGCDDDKMRGWQAGWVEGQVVVEAGLPQATGSSRVWARSFARQAYAVHWPPGLDSRQVQRVPGSWLEGTP